MGKLCHLPQCKMLKLFSTWVHGSCTACTARYVTHSLAVKTSAMLVET